MQELGNTRNEDAEDGVGEKDNHFVSTGNGSIRKFVQSGTQNIQTNAETYHDNRSNIDQQHVHGTLQLQHARIQQINQNSFSGPISIRASTIASNSSRLTAIPAAASLLRSADRLHRSFIECSADKGDVQSSSPFLLFRNQLQQIQNALKPGQNNEHRLDLISFQDYFLVLVQAFQLFTDIDQNMADLDPTRQGKHVGHETRAKYFHAEDVDELNDQLKHQCAVLNSATYLAAQQSARKVTELGDRRAEQYSKDLAEIDQRIRHAKKLLSSMTVKLPQLEKLATASQTISTANVAAQAEWERELLASPAYSRALQLAASNRFSISSRQSTARSEAWPSLDLISLANISIISVVDLPVLWDSLSMSQRNELGSINETAELKFDQSSPHMLLPDGSQDAEQNLIRKRERLAFEPTLVQRVLMQKSGLKALAGRQAMWHALATGDEAEFRALLARGLSPSSRDQKSRNTLLEEAAKTGNANFVKIILDQSQPESEEFANAVLLSVIYNHINCVEAFICHGIEIRASWKEHHPLGLAASLGRWKIVELFLPIVGHAINHISNGKTPLALAIEGDHLPVVEILLTNDHVDINGNGPCSSPLMIAITRGRTEIAQALILSGRSDLHHLNVLKETALSQAFDQQNDKIARLLLETDAETLQGVVVNRDMGYLTEYAQNLVCDFIVHDKDGLLFRIAVLSQEIRMVLTLDTLLRNPALVTGDIVQQRLEHAMTIGDLPLVCTLRNHIWSGNVPSFGGIGVSIDSLRSAARNHRFKELLEVFVGMDRFCVASQNRRSYVDLTNAIDDVQELIRGHKDEQTSEKIDLGIQRLGRLQTELCRSSQHPDSDKRFLFRRRHSMTERFNQQAPIHWSELPARTLLTQRRIT